MDIVAVVCEYNPFHTGHKYQLDFIRQNFDNPYIISLMSGNFVQRGDVSILDKHTRAKIAIQNGSDLVLELPCFFSTQVAPIFSTGALSVLDSLNCVDYLCFGSESNDLDSLTNMADFDLYADEKKSLTLKKNLKKGNSFIKAVSNISSIPNNSNDILAVEYIRSIKKLNSSIKPFPIQRLGSNYNDDTLGSTYSSATSIRNHLKSANFSQNIDIVGEFLPQNSLKYFDESYLKFDEDFYKYIKYHALIKNSSLSDIFEVNEGIENLIIKNLSLSNDFDTLASLCKSKRYTYTRIRRILFNILLDIKKIHIDIIKSHNFFVPYVRVLSFNNNGRKILKTIKNNSDINVINKVSTYIPKTPYEDMFFQKDILSTNIYNMDKKSYFNNDFLVSPIYLDI